MKALLISMPVLLFAACDHDEKPCIDQSKIDPYKECYDIYEPVCGCDGKTYPNSCRAEGAGVTSWMTGVCKK